MSTIFPVQGEPKSHIDHAACWCRPTKTYTDPITATEVWVHRADRSRGPRAPTDVEVAVAYLVIAFGRWCKRTGFGTPSVEEYRAILAEAARLAEGTDR